MPFELWRQDDNGNRFLVGSYPERSATEEKLAELTRALHKQTYWIEERTEEGCISRHRRTDELFTTRRQLFTCPHCGERISMLLDLSTPYQRYIEDCEVCCNPIEITCQTEEGRIVSFQAGLQ